MMRKLFQLPSGYDGSWFEPPHESATHGHQSWSFAEMVYVQLRILQLLAPTRRAG